MLGEAQIPQAPEIHHMQNETRNHPFKPHPFHPSYSSWTRATKGWNSTVACLFFHNPYPGSRSTAFLVSQQWTPNISWICFIYITTAVKFKTGPSFICNILIAIYLVLSLVSTGLYLVLILYYLQKSVAIKMNQKQYLLPSNLFLSRGN